MSADALTRIERLLPSLTAEEKVGLLQKIEHKLGNAPPRLPQPLKDAWKGKFPSDLDLEALLTGIRHGWHNETEDIAGIGNA